MSPDAVHTQFNSQRDPALPSIEHCILHLRLLAAFARLRQSVRTQNGLFGCHDSDGVSKGDLRWTIYIAQAVGRFERWHDALLMQDGVIAQPWKDVGTGSRGFTAMDLREDPPPRFTWIAPPLDVLMVLHSYMLNPRDFLQDCLRRGSLSLWKAGFPWAVVEENVDAVTFSYTAPPAAVTVFETACGIKWDLVASEVAEVRCPFCSVAQSVPWVELYSGENDHSEKGNTKMPFRAPCSACGQTMSQATLILARLRKDLLALKDDGTPVPGTLLARNGRALSSYVHDHTVSDRQPFLLNDLLKSRSNDVVSDALSNGLKNGDAESTMNKFREDLEQKIASSEEASQPAMTIALKRLMAKYYQNSSPFALDLVGAVLRQGTFVTKMEYFDWLHCTAVETIVAQAIERYTGFFAVMSAHPKDVAVPCQDVDLIWHTHQLSPSDYYDYSTRTCKGVFIDHDDKIGDGVLGNSFEWTCEAFEKITGQTYDKCLCWVCGLLEDNARHPSPSEATASKSLASRIKNKLKRSESKQQPSSAEIEVIRIQLRKFEADFANSQAEAVKAGGGSSTKLDFYHAYKWHHPAYAPLPQELMP
jgi:hypothetical protein